MRANDGAVYQQVLIASVLDQHCKHLLPDTGSRPAREALVHGLVFSISLGQVTPTGARAQDPEHAIDEGTIVQAAAPRV